MVSIDKTFCTLMVLSVVLGGVGVFVLFFRPDSHMRVRDVPLIVLSTSPCSFICVNKPTATIQVSLVLLDGACPTSILLSNAMTGTIHYKKTWPFPSASTCVPEGEYEDTVEATVGSAILLVASFILLGSAFIRLVWTLVKTREGRS